MNTLSLQNLNLQALQAAAIEASKHAPAGTVLQALSYVLSQLFPGQIQQPTCFTYYVSA